MLAKARGNRFFKVNEGTAPAKEPDVKITQTKGLGPITPPPAFKAEPEQKPYEPEGKTGYSPAKKKVRKPKAAAAHKSAHR